MISKKERQTSKNLILQNNVTSLILEDSLKVAENTAANFLDKFVSCPHSLKCTINQVIDECNGIGFNKAFTFCGVCGKKRVKGRSANSISVAVQHFYSHFFIDKNSSQLQKTINDKFRKRLYIVCATNLQRQKTKAQLLKTKLQYIVAITHLENSLFKIYSCYGSTIIDLHKVYVKNCTCNFAICEKSHECICICLNI